MARGKKLDESIEIREREANDAEKDLRALHTRLGRLVLEADDKFCKDFCAPYREQNDALLAKVLSFEERLDELEKKEGGNVFTWIGKNAQGIVLRSFHTKAKESLEQLRRTAGEHYSRRTLELQKEGLKDEDNLPVYNAEIEQVHEQAEIRRSDFSSLTEEVLAFKEERRQITGSYSSEGGPAKYIVSLSARIDVVKGELKALHKRVGALAALPEAALCQGWQKHFSQGTADEKSENSEDPKYTKEKKSFIETFILQDDREMLDNAMHIYKTIQESDASIAKLRASLAIDDEKAKIEKIQRLITDQRDKIEKAEKNIACFEEEIKTAQSVIEKLKADL
jgi:hypothetical protein